MGLPLTGPEIGIEAAPPGLEDPFEVPAWPAMPVEQPEREGVPA